MIDLVNPRRSAHASIRGYLYQTCLGVLRWLDLGEDEMLLCEGDEDLDRLLRHGEGISEQVKSYTGELNIRDRAVMESLRGFLLTYVTLHRDRGETRRFVFTTTARRRQQRTHDLAVDVLESWDDADQREAVVEALRELLPLEEDSKKAARAVEDALGWLDGKAERWPAFLGSVTWDFEAPDLDDVRRQIDERLGERAVFTDRLVAELLRTSSQAEPGKRVRTRKDLENVLASSAAKLAQWQTSREATRLCEVFGELKKLRRLLHAKTRELPDEPGPAVLLTAAYEVIPFEEAARREELDALAAWCAKDQAASAWLFTGEGGVGKTRLLIEWCERLERQGWHAGFLYSAAVEADLPVLLEGAVPRLVVIDYAETRLGVLRLLLERMAFAPADAPKLRLVLLSRRAGDWWRSLQTPEVEGLLEPPRSLAAPIADEAERREVNRRAAWAFAAVLDREPPEPHEKVDFERALYIHMAALAAVYGEQIETEGKALKSTLRRERKFWQQQIAASGVEPLVARALTQAAGPLVAGLTLAGGVDNESAGEVLAAQVAGRLAARERFELLDLLRTLYGGTESYLEGLQPDLLGEELVAEELKRDPALLDRVLDVTSDGHTSLTLLTRLAQRRPEETVWLEAALKGRMESLAAPAFNVAVETGDPVGAVLAELVATEGSIELAAGLMRRCDGPAYQQSIPLRELAAVVTRACLDARRAKWTEPNGDQLKELSRITLNLGCCLNDLGRREEAFETTREVVDTYRQLAKAQPDAFLPELATSLNNLGMMLSALGRREEALKATSEAIDIRCQLAKARPDAFLADLAASLNNLGNGLSDLGRREEALKATSEAVDIRRQLAQAQPGAFLPNLAMSLNNLGCNLGDLGRREKALEATSEATDIRRQLAKARPDAFLADFAASLNNLGNGLSDLGRREEALKVTREAVDTYRQLAKMRPAAFLTDLAASLNNLGGNLGDLGQRGEALEAIREAVFIYRQLAQARPDAFLPDLAMSLNNLGGNLGDLGQRGEALEAIREAVFIRHQLAQARPDAFLPDLAASLSNLGKMLSALGRREDALKAGEESVRLLLPFCQRYPDRFCDWMGIWSRNYVSHSKALQLEPDAELLQQVEEAMVGGSDPTNPDE